MKQKDILPHLYKAEYRKIIAVLCKSFGIAYIEIAEDIVSETFLIASETWSSKGIPENPTAWIYTVAKNKAKDYLKRDTLFTRKIAQQLTYSTSEIAEIEVDLSDENSKDSQLQMLFAVCHPSISTEAQIGLALRIICSIGIDEIAAAFLSNKETITKRLFRAKEKLRIAKVKIEFPNKTEMNKRLEAVLTTIYLLYNEGYYPSGRNSSLRKELCLEAMWLAQLLVENKATNTPAVNALLALMCFNSSRFEARTNKHGEIVLYEEQDTTLWNAELIARGSCFLDKAAQGDEISKYHLEAGIAYWYTVTYDTKEKWESILQLYNHLLQIAYSPIAALNRTYALSKANGKAEAIVEAEKLQLTNNYLYHTLLGELYTTVNNQKAKLHFQTALQLAKSKADKLIITNKLRMI